MTYDFNDEDALWDLLPIVDHLDWKVDKYGWIRAEGWSLLDPAFEDPIR